jgi:ribose 5-phosphate isomerase A
MVVGSAGSTASIFTANSANPIESHRHTDVRGIRAPGAGIGLPLTTFNEHPEIDVTVDGADEVSPQLDLIKGLGGALVREKLSRTLQRRHYRDESKPWSVWAARASFRLR